MVFPSRQVERRNETLRVPWTDCVSKSGAKHAREVVGRKVAVAGRHKLNAYARSVGALLSREEATK